MATDNADVLELLLTERHSCRSFRPEPVVRATIERILRMAQRAVSSNNSQPWQVVITSGEETERFRKAFYDEAVGVGAYGHGANFSLDYPRAEFRGRYKERRRECGGQLYSSVGLGRDQVEEAKMLGLENFQLFGAPHAALITTDAHLGPFGLIDCGAYVSNFLLAAQSLGVASIPQGAFAYFAPFMRRYFALSDERLVVCGISFGYAEIDAPINQFRTSRADLTEAVTWLDDGERPMRFLDEHPANVAEHGVPLS